MMPHPERILRKLRMSWTDGSGPVSRSRRRASKRPAAQFVKVETPAAPAQSFLIFKNNSKL
jgi:hypothetical protein